MDYYTRLEQTRQNRKESILQAALSLLLDKDWSQVTMSEIGERAQVSRVTLYKYFSSLHDIIFELQMRFMKNITTVDKSEIPDANGAEKLGVYLQKLIQIYSTHFDEIRFTAMFDFTYKNDFPSEELRIRYKESMDSRENLLLQIIQEGVEDGSISTMLDPHMLSTLFNQTMMSLLQRMALRGHLIQKQKNIYPEYFLQYLSTFLSEAVKTSPNLETLKKLQTKSEHKKNYDIQTD